MKKNITLSLIAASMGAGVIHAAPIYYEGFDYDNGTVLNTTAWNGGDASVLINNPGTLDLGQLATTGGDVVTSPSDNFNVVTSSISTAGLLDDGDSLWFSFAIEGDLSGSNAHMGFAFGDDDVTHTFNGVNSGGNAIGMYWRGAIDATSWNAGSRDGQGSGDTVSFTATPDGGDSPDIMVEHLVVGRIVWGASSDTITAWLIDDLTTLPNEATLTATASTTHTTAANLDQSVFNTISFAIRDTSADAPTIDEIRFGASYDDVVVIAVPEPSSFALLAGCFGLAWMMVRRRG